VGRWVTAGAVTPGSRKFLPAAALEVDMHRRAVPLLPVACAAPFPAAVLNPQAQATAPLSGQSGAIGLRT
jgi:hypothetical protein